MCVSPVKWLLSHFSGSSKQDSACACVKWMGGWCCGFKERLLACNMGLSPGMSGVKSGEREGLVKVCQEIVKEGGEGWLWGRSCVTTQMRRTCADTVKLSHFVGSASLILMFKNEPRSGDLGMQLFSPIKGNICQDHKSSYWTVIY